jgi:hypothetical protein
MTAVPKPTRKAKKKRKKLPSLPSLVKKADQVFSLFIRNRDAVELQGRCCTCGAPGNQCGHYIKRSYKKLRWNPKNAALQCVKCNHFMDGNQDSFAIFLIEKYGTGILQELAEQKIPHKPTREELNKIIEAYS